MPENAHHKSINYMEADMQASSSCHLSVIHATLAVYKRYTLKRHHVNLGRLTPSCNNCFTKLVSPVIELGSIPCRKRFMGSSFGEGVAFGSILLNLSAFKAVLRLVVVGFKPVNTP